MLLSSVRVLSFLILTTTDLPEAYFLGAVLESLLVPFALVNIVGRPVTNQLQVLTRLRRNRGLAYVADFLLARAADRVEMAAAQGTPAGGARVPRGHPAAP